MAVKEEVKVKESIEKIESELIELWNRKETLEAEKQALINENPEAVLEIDLGLISKALENFNSINRTDYSDYDKAYDFLNSVYHEINYRLESFEEESDVDTVEEEAVELEGK